MYLPCFVEHVLWKLTSTKFVENVISSLFVENILWKTDLNKVCGRIGWKSEFHKVCGKYCMEIRIPQFCRSIYGKQFSIEVFETKFPLESSLPGVDEFTLKADSVSNLAKAGHAQLQYMKLSPLREISTQGGNRRGMKMLMVLYSASLLWQTTT